MIVRDMPGGRVLCLHQTTHALMSAGFSRHWGNRDFARPEPYDVVMTAIAQHDNGWWEWELAPQVCADGYPMDFLRGPTAEKKLDLWRLGIRRAHAQHPYAGLLIWRHAAFLHEMLLDQIDDAQVRAANETFIAGVGPALDEVRSLFAGDPVYDAWLSDAMVDANASLLRFSDFASLQVAMPWPRQRIMHDCPVDWAGTTVEIIMEHEGDLITFDPWPFDVEEFEIGVHGRLLDQRHFADAAEYQAALAIAPIHCLRWRVVRGG